MIFTWLRDLKCRFGPCEPDYVRQQPSPALLDRLDLVPRKIDDLIARERNLVEEAYLRGIGVEDLEERQSHGQ